MSIQLINSVYAIVSPRLRYQFVLFLFRSVWARFLTADPRAWMVRVGEHNMFVDQGTHVDIAPSKIIFHPDRNREFNDYMYINKCTNA